MNNNSLLLRNQTSTKCYGCMSVLGTEGIGSIPIVETKNINKKVIPMVVGQYPNVIPILVGDGVAKPNEIKRYYGSYKIQRNK